METLPGGPAADIKVTTSDLRGQVGRIQNQVKEIQEVVRMYSSTTGPRRVRRGTVRVRRAEAEREESRHLLSLQSAAAAVYTHRAPPTHPPSTKFTLFAHRRSLTRQKSKSLNRQQTPQPNTTRRTPCPP